MYFKALEEVSITSDQTFRAQLRLLTTQRKDKTYHLQNTEDLSDQSKAKAKNKNGTTSKRWSMTRKWVTTTVKKTKITAKPTTTKMEPQLRTADQGMESMTKKRSARMKHTVKRKNTAKIMPVNTDYCNHKINYKQMSTNQREQAILKSLVTLQHKNL